MQLDQLNNGLEKTREMLEHKKPAKGKLTEQDDEPLTDREVKDESLALLADAYVTFLAKVEKNLDHEFESPKDAFAFLTSAVKQFRTRGKSMLMKKLRVFERVGAQKTLRRAKRGM